MATTMPPDPYSDFAKLLQSRCETRKLTLDGLHRGLFGLGIKVTQQAVRHWLAGHRVPRLHHLEVLLDLLELRGGERDVARRLYLDAVTHPYPQPKPVKSDNAAA